MWEEKITTDNTEALAFELTVLAVESNRGIEQVLEYYEKALAKIKEIKNAGNK